MAGIALVPCLAGAQSVVVRHVVQAEVLPRASVRDSGWVMTYADSGTVRWTWSAELRANSALALQVLGPEGADPATRVRVGSGPWVQLQSRAWNAIAIVGAGEHRIAIEYSTTAGTASSNPPDVRIR